MGRISQASASSATSVRDRTAAAVAAAQLGFGIAGLAVAVRRRHPVDIPLLTGSPDTVSRDALLMGTAFSAPAPMLVAQTVCTIAVAAHGDARAAKGLRLLGAAMVGGYLVERQVRRRLRPRGWDPVETPLVAAGLGLAGAMAVLRTPRSR